MALKTENTEVKLIIPSDPKFPTQNFDMSQNPNGLIVCRDKSLPEGQQSPDGVKRTEFGIFITPTNQDTLMLPNRSGLVIPTDQQIIQLSNPVVCETPKRSSAELARALYNPYLFLATEVEKTLKNSELPFLDVIVANLKNFGKGESEDKFYTSIVTNRIKKSIRLYDKSTDSEEFIEKSSPGALEATGLVIASILKEAEFKGEYNLIALDPLNHLLEVYRLETQNSKELPEMPDLTDFLIESLDNFSAVPNVRLGIYSILEQIKLPFSQQETLIKKMDKAKDLDQPLAFQLTLALAEDNPNSPWVKLQEERRNALLEQLSGTNQEMFDNYQQLLNLSQGLVYHGDPLNPEPGKVGMEIEFTKPLPEKTRGVEYITEDVIKNFDELCHTNGLDTAWIVGYDEYNNRTSEYNKELRRNDQNLNYDFEYLKSFVDLSKWFGDHARKLLSLHLHFDRDAHPNKPILGNLFFEYSTGSSIKKNDLGTWEVRCLNLPRSKGRIHPARIEDLIGLYLSATKVCNGPKVANKIRIFPESEFKPDQLVFGHICSYITEPTGRLATLMAQHDPVAIRNFTPLAFANSFDISSIPSIVSKLTKTLRGNDLRALNVLTAFAEGRVIVDADKTINDNPDLSPDDVYLFDRVRGSLSYYAAMEREQSRQVETILIHGTEHERMTNILESFAPRSENNIRIDQTRRGRERIEIFNHLYQLPEENSILPRIEQELIYRNNEYLTEIFPHNENLISEAISNMNFSEDFFTRNSDLNNHILGSIRQIRDNEPLPEQTILPSLIEQISILWYFRPLKNLNQPFKCRI